MVCFWASRWLIHGRGTTLRTFFHGAQCEVFDPSVRTSERATQKWETPSRRISRRDAVRRPNWLRSAEGIDDDSLDRLKKNVDSGRIAILDS